MYCVHCGAKLQDDAVFCEECGKRIDEVADAAPGSGYHKTLSKKRGVTKIPIILLAVAAIMVVSVVAAKTNKSSGETKSGGQNQSYSSQDEHAAQLPVDEILKQCPACQPALEVYEELNKLTFSWTADKEEIEALILQKSRLMQHDCKAEPIHVEGVRCAYLGSTGYYSGDWVGAGPSGSGSYFGLVYNDTAVTFEGDWKYGLPDGEGVLFVENYIGYWDMTYIGGMKDGLRDGKGLWYERSEPEHEWEQYGPRYSIYEEAIYSQNRLTEPVRCATYDGETGELCEYQMRTTDERGYALPTSPTWGPNDLSPQEYELLSKVTVGVTVAMIAMLAGHAIETIIHDDDPGRWDRHQDMLVWLNEQDEKKEKERIQSEIAAKKREISHIDNFEMYELEKQGLKGSAEYRDYEDRIGRLNSEVNKLENR